MLHLGLLEFHVLKSRRFAVLLIAFVYILVLKGYIVGQHLEQLLHVLDVFLHYTVLLRMYLKVRICDKGNYWRWKFTILIVILFSAETPVHIQRATVIKRLSILCYQIRPVIATVLLSRF